MTELKSYTVQLTNQSSRIRNEILLALDGGIKDKQQIYNIVAEKTDSPRPTVRRVASKLKKDLEKYHEIMSSSNRISHPLLDCPSCHENIIKRRHKRCPNCKVILDWSDEN